jgi:hypothetical protein
MMMKLCVLEESRRRDRRHVIKSSNGTCVLLIFSFLHLLLQSSIIQVDAAVRGFLTNDIDLNKDNNKDQHEKERHLQIRKQIVPVLPKENKKRPCTKPHGSSYDDYRRLSKQKQKQQQQQQQQRRLSSWYYDEFNDHEPTEETPSYDHYSEDGYHYSGGGDDHHGHYDTEEEEEEECDEDYEESYHEDYYVRYVSYNYLCSLLSSNFHFVSMMQLTLFFVFHTGCWRIRKEKLWKERRIR